MICFFFLARLCSAPRVLRLIDHGALLPSVCCAEGYGEEDEEEGRLMFVRSTLAVVYVFGSWNRLCRRNLFGGRTVWDVSKGGFCFPSSS